MTYSQMRVSTYLPPWESGGRRVPGPDEDAVTMAVEGGRRALDGTAERVVLITRDLPLLEGGNGAALLAGLGLPNDVAVTEQVGGSPAALDAVATALPGTLVIAVDRGGAGAVLVGRIDAVRPMGRSQRSLPMRLRRGDGRAFEDDDPRLVRERGTRPSLARVLGDAKPLAVAGLNRRDALAFCEGDPPELPTTGASAAVFALAAVIERRTPGPVAAVEQATAAAVTVDPGDAVLDRYEPLPRPLPARRVAPGPDIKIALSAYDRAFDAKLGWRAGQCRSCGTLALPPRHRCLQCGTEGESDLVALPREAEVYTTTTVHVTVPGLASPYTLAVVQLDGVDVRALVHVTDSPPGTVEIGDRGRLVLRRVAERSGVPDYGFAFSPEVAP